MPTLTLKAKTAARKFTVTTGGGSLSIPGQVNRVLIRNTGANDVAINFNSDGVLEFFRILAGETLPVAIGLAPGTTANAQAIGGDSELQCIFWGE
jgi:hypothetical protein